MPARAKELTLVVEDPDASRFIHWTVLKVPRRARAFREGSVPRGAIETKNTFGKRGWGGPCPSQGDSPHHYTFALYALRKPLGLEADASPDVVRSQVGAEALARGELTGRFGR